MTLETGCRGDPWWTLCVTPPDIERKIALRFHWPGQEYGQAASQHATEERIGTLEELETRPVRLETKSMNDDRPKRNKSRHPDITAVKVMICRFNTFGNLGRLSRVAIRRYVLVLRKLWAMMVIQKTRGCFTLPTSLNAATCWATSATSLEIAGAPLSITSKQSFRIIHSQLDRVASDRPYSRARTDHIMGAHPSSHGVKPNTVLAEPPWHIFQSTAFNHPS